MEVPLSHMVHVTLSINTEAGSGAMDTGYCVVAIKFNKGVREELISPTPHLWFLKTIMFEIAYAKHMRT